MKLCYSKRNYWKLLIVFIVSLLLSPKNKANGKAANICQRFHDLFVKAELGLNQNTSSVNKYFIQLIKTNSQVIANQTTFIKQ